MFFLRENRAPLNCSSDNLKTFTLPSWYYSICFERETQTSFLKRKYSRWKIIESTSCLSLRFNQWRGVHEKFLKFHYGNIKSAGVLYHVLDTIFISLTTHVSETQLINTSISISNESCLPVVNIFYFHICGKYIISNQKQKVAGFVECALTAYFGFGVWLKSSTPELLCSICVE